ncbi:hypothetical protein [Azotobacter salinestris]|uniref:hypothetical protein n=1 Tax=Azotobacter salinestris TaxID=69964 RepID=UPI0032DEE60C
MHNRNQNTAFEAAMRALGYRNFEQERGRYCLQVLNELKQAFIAGQRAQREVERG